MTRLGRSLTAEQWHAPSLCSAWMVRDVYGHMTYGGVTPWRRLLPAMVFTYRFNINRGSEIESRRYAAEHSQGEVMDAFERSSLAPVGIATRIKPDEMYVDHLIHELDIRRPLQLASEFTDEQLVAALDIAVRLKTPLFAPAKLAHGLRWNATDLDWTWGDDAHETVSGRAEDLLLALGGRSEGLGALAGTGLPTLTMRIGS